jgi:ABC-type ATPase involved in cell division
MKVDIDMGAAAGGGVANLDLEELLATRLLVQGNSGSGKSHLLRRLLEQSATRCACASTVSRSCSISRTSKPTSNCARRQPSWAGCSM